MQYEFENRVVLEMSEKFMIAPTNILVYYLIINMSYIGLLLIINLMFIGIKFEIPGKAVYTYDNSIKPRQKTRLS